MVPSCAMAGELKMMSPVAYDHLSDPSRATSYSLPSCEPNSTDPSSAIAGDETIGPPGMNVHQTAGFLAGSTNGERPRWAGPRRNIGWTGSTAYCGSGSGCVVGGPAGPYVVITRGRVGRLASAGQRQWPAWQIRSALQS